MDEYVSNLNQGESLRLELERTRVAYQALLDEMNEQSYHLPSINPAWRIGELFITLYRPCVSCPKMCA